MNSFERIIKLLQDNNVPYTHLTHEHVHTSQDAAQVRGMSAEQGAKAIILEARDSKNAKFYLQAVLNGNRRINHKALKQLTGYKKLALAPPEKVLELTGLTIGSIPPFGFLWDIPIYVDAHLTTNETIAFSAATHTDSIIMKLEDYLNVVQHTVAVFSE
ncbi:MAG: YbaK/EbsC family protein [Candidatus Woesearchaeota archaeon]